EGRHYSCRASCGGSVILVDEAAESVAAADLACEWSVLPFVGLGRPELESTMRSVPVVVIDVDVQDALEVPAVEDEQPVQTLGAHHPHEALRDRVRLWCSHRCLDDPNALAAEDLIERTAVLAVPVADQEAHALVRSRGRDSAPAA